MLSISQVKTGQIIQLDGDPYEVLKAIHTKPGKGHAILKTKVKNLANGNVLEKTFQGADKIEETDVTESKAQYLYKDNNGFYFMNQESFEQFSLPDEIIGDKSKYLIEGTEISILNYDDKPINISLPIKIDLRVRNAPPGVKGNTADGGTKEVETETGHMVQVPLFINEGDIIKVDTRDGNYVERVN